MKDENEKMNLFIYILYAYDFRLGIRRTFGNEKRKIFNFFHETCQINACVIMNMTITNDGTDESFFIHSDSFLIKITYFGTLF